MARNPELRQHTMEGMLMIEKQIELPLRYKRLIAFVIFDWMNRNPMARYIRELGDLAVSINVDRQLIEYINNSFEVVEFDFEICNN